MIPYKLTLETALNSDGMSQLQEQERRVDPQKGQCPERLGRNPLCPPQVLIFSLHVVNSQPYMCKREVGLGFDMASVGVMDVQKSNPSQGRQVAPSRPNANNSVLEKNFFSFLLFVPKCYSIHTKLEIYAKKEKAKMKL